MLFLNPFMLLGIAAIGVPIAIHLLNRQKHKRVIWAAMRFLRVATEKNQRRLRIEDLLLLILRCLVVAILALALARPAVRAMSAAGFLGRGNVMAVIALDNSYSMSGTDGVSSRFENAKKAADQIIDSLPAGSAVAVLLVNDGVDAIIPEPTYDLNLARHSIDQAKLTDRSTELFPAFRTGLAALKKAGGHKELYLLTDGQRGGWAQFPAIRHVLDDSHEDVDARLVLVGPAVKQNLGVSALNTSGDICAVDRPLHVEVTVTNFGTTDASNVPVQLRIDSRGEIPAKTGAEKTAGPNLQDAPVDESTVDLIPAGGSRVVSLFGKLREPGAHAVVASIPADAMPSDDRRTLVVRGLSKVKVLVVDGDTGTAASKTGGFFIRHALLPIPAAEIPGYFISVKTVAASELPGMKLEDYDAVITSNVPDFDPKTADALGEYVRNGGGLVIFPGANISASLYNQQLGDRVSLLPAKIGSPRGEAGQEEKFFTLQAKNFEHRIASIWNDPTAGSPAGAHFFRCFELAPDATPAAPVKTEAPTAVSQTVLHFSDGVPAVMERPVGMGRVVLFASSADTSWNDLPVRPGIFVPLMYRVLGSIVSRQDESLNIGVGQRFAYRPPLDSLGRDVTITPPDGIRETRKVELQGTTAIVHYDDTSIAGAYGINIAGDSPIDLKFAAQPDKTESHLELLNENDLGSLGQAMQIVKWTPGAALDQTIRTARAGTELWTMLALTVLMLAMMETFLANWFSEAK